MLREHYPTDKRFEELLGYVPELSPELTKIDSYLQDEKLCRLIRADLAKRRLTSFIQPVSPAFLSIPRSGYLDPAQSRQRNLGGHLDRIIQIPGFN